MLSHLAKTKKANVGMEHGGPCKLRHSMELSEGKHVELDTIGYINQIGWQ